MEDFWGTMNSQTDIESICKKVRRNIVQMVFDAKSGHIGGSMSSVEIMAVLYSEFLSHRPDAVSYTHLTLPTNREV